MAKPKLSGEQMARFTMFQQVLLAALQGKAQAGRDLEATAAVVVDAERLARAAVVCMEDEWVRLGSEP